jgi:DNA-binding transcriptional MocR family regulator
MILTRPDIDAIATARGLPLYQAVAEGLAAAIAVGRLQPGDRLPTHRALSHHLGVTVSTITQAYAEASRRRLVSGEIGRGTFVLAESREAALFTLERRGEGRRIDLSTNVPADLAGPAIAEALAGFDAARIARTATYPGAEDLARAKLAIVRLLEGRGLRPRAAEITPCAGAQQALTVALLALAGRGGDILCEAVTSPGVKAAARSLGLRLHPVPMDGEGIDPEALARIARASGARTVVLVPALQNPTGAIMRAARREAVAEVVRGARLTLVEDDVYGPLVDEPAVAALCWERALVASSLSKTVAPGLRFGWLAGGHPGLADIARDIHLTAWGLAPLASALAVAMIESGAAAGLVARQRDEIAQRQRLARRILGPAASSPAAPHLWRGVVGGADAAAASAAAVGVDVASGDLFAPGRGETGHVRLCITAPATRALLVEGLERLAGLPAFAPSA